MVSEAEIKRQVRDFYDQVGWQEVSEGCYQNAAYEDLRPVSSEYIHRCHLRLLRHLKADGRCLLDAGCGPIQYPEYLEYSRGYNFRVCADISFVALLEARKRIGAHGLYVVADIARLPFEDDVFDGVVSLHTIHHLHPEEHLRAYQELHRTLARDSSAIIVNGWDNPPLTVLTNWLIHLIEKLYRIIKPPANNSQGVGKIDRLPVEIQHQSQTGTYVRKHDARWLAKEVGSRMPVQIWCWRSVSVRLLRTLIHEKWGGRVLLRGLFWLEEHMPHFFGKYGQYPLIVIHKTAGKQ